MQNEEKKPEVEIHPVLKKPIHIQPNDDGTCEAGYYWDQQTARCILDVGNSQ